MKVTYLKHSGFLIEWEHCYWIFDYYQGKIPQLDEGRPIFVFCSHSHSDHFNPAVFALGRQYPKVSYIFSSQVRSACRKLERKSGGVCLTSEEIAQVCGKTEEGRVLSVPEVYFLAGRSETMFSDEAGEMLKVFTLRSTDCGCAFLINYRGKTIYHAGDLHWWIWANESEAANQQMTGNFKKEMEYVEGNTIDLAFVPLDARLEETYGWGMSYFLEHAEVRHVFPMHFWDDFSVMDRYEAEYPLPAHTQFHKISSDGMSWEL